MSELFMEVCSSCGKDVSTQQEKKQRRLLSGHALQSVYQTLKDFIGKVQGNQENTGEIAGGYICRSCVRLIERHNSLSDELCHNVRKALSVLQGTNSALVQPMLVTQTQPHATSVTPSDSTTKAGSPALTVKLFSFTTIIDISL